MEQLVLSSIVIMGQMFGIGIVLQFIGESIC